MAVPPPFPDPERPRPGLHEASQNGSSQNEPGLDEPAPAIKAALRRDLRARRLHFAGDSGAIDRLLTPLLARQGPIAGYIAHRGEPDILPFLLKALQRGQDVAVPHVVAGAMHFRRWHPDIALAPGPLGILQAIDDEPVEPAIVLAPLVGFDRAGRRLGQGGGFYDRWFASHPTAMRIGIAWSVQEVPALVSEAWDVPLHAVVTEKEWIAP